MKLETVLEKLEKLFKEWSLGREDWILVANYALKLQGYESKLRKSHLNTMINKGKLPWNVKEGFEVFPPKKSLWAQNYIKWMKSTGFETDLIAYDIKKIRKYLKYSVIYKLPNRKSIRLITMKGNLISLNDFLVHCREKEAGTDKGLYLLDVIRDLQVAAGKRKDEESAVLAGKILRKYKNLARKKYNRKQIFDGEIKGKGICGGKIVGQAKVIQKRGSKNVDTKEKIILVTKMTSPDFVTIISKIKGIVTDEGGRLCHAAILAREFGIPCVIATEIATKVINDGDLIELDADLGIVKVLKRKTRIIKTGSNPEQ